jgi:hypothetical protein
MTTADFIGRGCTIVAIVLGLYLLFKEILP